MSRDTIPFATEVRLVRIEQGISMHDAKRQVMYRRMMRDLDRAETLGDAKHVLHRRLNIYGVRSDTACSGVGDMKYTVKRGDTLWSIAQRFYGHASNARIIHADNRDVIGDDPARIVPGQVLTLMSLHLATADAALDWLTEHHDYILYSSNGKWYVSNWSTVSHGATPLEALRDAMGR